MVVKYLKTLLALYSLAAFSVFSQAAAKGFDSDLESGTARDPDYVESNSESESEPLRRKNKRQMRLKNKGKSTRLEAENKCLREEVLRLDQKLAKEEEKRLRLQRQAEKEMKEWLEETQGGFSDEKLRAEFAKLNAKRQDFLRCKAQKEELSRLDAQKLNILKRTKPQKNTKN